MSFLIQGHGTWKNGREQDFENSNYLSFHGER